MIYFELDLQNVMSENKIIYSWYKMSYLKTDPFKLLKYTNKFVKITTKSDKKIFIGWLYTIDPISMRFDSFFLENILVFSFTLVI